MPRHPTRAETIPICPFWCTFTRRVPLPETNLDGGNGSIGISGHDSTYVFFVAYPFVTVVAQELYDLGDGRRECALEVDRALLWTGRRSAPPSLRATWYTHRSPGWSAGDRLP